MNSLNMTKQHQHGVALLEVLITMVVLAVGLLGLAGLEVRLHGASIESYERSQALILLNDMESRIASNRNAAASYVTTTPLGVGATCISNPTTQVQRDMGEWCNQLQGAAEIIGTDKLGAMIGGRGCVEALGAGEYMVTVAWQGLVPTSPPPTSVSCGVSLYNGISANTNCNNDLCRRAITTIVRIATLS